MIIVRPHPEGYMVSDEPESLDVEGLCPEDAAVFGYAVAQMEVAERLAKARAEGAGVTFFPKGEITTAADAMLASAGYSDAEIIETEAALEKVTSVQALATAVKNIVSRRAMPGPEDVLTPSEVAEVLGIPLKTITMLCRTGRMEGAWKPGRQWRIPGWSVRKEAGLSEGTKGKGR